MLVHRCHRASLFPDLFHVVFQWEPVCCPTWSLLNAGTSYRTADWQQRNRNGFGNGSSKSSMPSISLTESLRQVNECCLVYPLRASLLKPIYAIVVEKGRPLHSSDSPSLRSQPWWWLPYAGNDGKQHPGCPRRWRRSPSPGGRHHDFLLITRCFIDRPSSIPFLRTTRIYQTYVSFDRRYIHVPCWVVSRRTIVTNVYQVKMVVSRRLPLSW